MYKTRKRLELSRETLYRLEDATLAGMLGGTYLSELTDCEACDPDPAPDPQPLTAPSACPCVL